MKYKVRRNVDAFVVFETVIEAESAAEAAQLAKRDEGERDWCVTGVQFFDAREFVAIDSNGEDIEVSRIGDF